MGLKRMRARMNVSLQWWRSFADADTRNFHQKRKQFNKFVTTISYVSLSYVYHICLFVCCLRMITITIHWAIRVQLGDREAAHHHDQLLWNVRVQSEGRSGGRQTEPCGSHIGLPQARLKNTTRTPPWEPLLPMPPGRLLGLMPTQKAREGEPLGSANRWNW